MRRTTTLTMVLSELLDRPNETRYAAQIKQAVGLQSATVCGILKRLTKAGWLTDSWDRGNHFYRLARSVEETREHFFA